MDTCVPRTCARRGSIPSAWSTMSDGSPVQARHGAVARSHTTLGAESVAAKQIARECPGVVVPVEPREHAKGPLVYGVFSTLPSELTVLAANGSTIYTENLRAKATEAAQFFEGYAEP
jgi:hypothetical protein